MQGKFPLYEERLRPVITVSRNSPLYPLPSLRSFTVSKKKLSRIKSCYPTDVTGLQMTNITMPCLFHAFQYVNENKFKK